MNWGFLFLDILAWLLWMAEVVDILRLLVVGERG